MNRLEFLNKVFTLFRKEPEKNETLLTLYDDEFCKTRKNVNWDKLYQMVVKEAENAALPMPYWFISKFDLCLMQGTSGDLIDGTKVFVLLDDGYQYEFECYQWSKNVQETRQLLKRKFAYFSTNEDGQEVCNTKVKEIRIVKQ